MQRALVTQIWNMWLKQQHMLLFGNILDTGDVSIMQVMLHTWGKFQGEHDLHSSLQHNLKELYEASILNKWQKNVQH